MSIVWSSFITILLCIGGVISFKTIYKKSGKTRLDAHQLCYVEEPSVEEKLVVQLALEIERSKDADYVVVSWASQAEAVAMFNRMGFCDTLDYMLTLQSKNSGGC